jgi:hypothetical protein
MTAQYILHMELIGDLDTIARLVTTLRKCKTKAEVRELKFRLGNGVVHAEISVDTSEIAWLVNKLSTLYEVQELSIEPRGE